MKKRVEGCDFVRGLCAIGIVIFHFFCHSNSSFKPFFNYVNGDWGSAIVTTFFALSGAVLYYNYEEISSLKIFYYKRWKSIYPMFYLAYIYYFIQQVYGHGELFYSKYLWLSMLGMDGYFLYRMDNYYILGEWFLGAIILLYLLYPLVLKVFKKSCLLTTIMVIIFYILMLSSNIFIINPFRNLFSCLLSFEMGMLMMKWNEYLEDKRVVIISLLIFCVVCIVPLPIDMNICNHLLGISGFVIMYNLGEKIMKLPYLSNIIRELSRLSYAIFLMHHIMILKALAFRNPVNPIKMLILLIIIIAMILCASKCLYIINNSILYSKYYQKIEKDILG